MKNLASLLLSSLLVIGLNSCSTGIQNDFTPLEQVNAQARASAYPFDLNRDFYPLFNTSNWEYEIFDTNTDKLLSTVVKTLDVNHENSLELDNKNKYYIVALKKDYSNKNIKDNDSFEFMRRRGNQLAFGKTDDLTYYPDKNASKPSNGSYDPYLFRPFIDFSKGKTEKITVKAGTFECIKSEFTLKLDKYTIWYAKGVGEVKRIKQGYFSGQRYELSRFSNESKQFTLKKEILELKDVPQVVMARADRMKSEYLLLNQLPAELFEGQSSNSIYVETKVTLNNRDKEYEVSFINKSLVSKDNVSLSIFMGLNAEINEMRVYGQDNSKPLYKGKVVDKLPTIKDK